MSVSNKVLCLFVCALTVSVSRYVWILTYGSSVFPDMLTATCLIACVVLLDIYRLQPAPTHTWFTLCSQYLFTKLGLTVGRLLKVRFDMQCKNYSKQQEKLLAKILKQNSSTVFFQDHGLHKVNSVEQYMRVMPLTKYKDYMEYVNMIKNDGAENISFPGKAFYIAYTSGTSSGKSKSFPKHQQTQARINILLLIAQYLMALSPLLLKYVFVKVSSKAFLSKSGIESGPVSSLYAKVQLPFTVVPEVCVLAEFDSLYIHLVYALSEEDTNLFSTVVSTTALTLFTILEKNWQELCDDIESGKLSQKLHIPEDEKTRLEARLTANPPRAEFLRKEFRKGFQGIIPRIWPHCQSLCAVKTGVFETPGKILEDKYLGDLPCFSLIHLGTESVYGINLTPTSQDINYTPLIPINFFEFIPEEEIGKESPVTVLSHQVTLGNHYEMVITTYDGLYRYRTEDVVQITDFHETTPVYKFIRRSGDILSAGLEKVPEFLVQAAIFDVIAKSSKKILSFTSCESVYVQKITGGDFLDKCYFVFVEMQDDALLSEEEIQSIDENLCKEHERYQAMRASGTLQPVRVLHVNPGTFDKVKQMVLSSNPDSFCMQYKLPRVMRREEVLQFILKERLN